VEGELVGGAGVVEVYGGSVWFTQGSGGLGLGIYLLRLRGASRWLRCGGRRCRGSWRGGRFWPGWGRGCLPWWRGSGSECVGGEGNSMGECMEETEMGREVDGRMSQTG